MMSFIMMAGLPIWAPYAALGLVGIISIFRLMRLPLVRVKGDVLQALLVGLVTMAEGRFTGSGQGKLKLG